MSQSRDTHHVLLVEDEPANQTMIRRALADSPLESRLTVVNDGVEALDYLGRSASPPPALILLDLNMPNLGGHDVVRALRADRRLRSVPIVVLTTSSDPHDIAASYDLGANSYIVKPAAFDALCRVLGVIQEYWFRTVELPPAA